MARAEKVLQFATVPRDLDRDAALVVAHHPERSRGDIVLAPDMQGRLERVIDEFRAQTDLARHGLSPKSRLLFVGPPGCGKTLCADILAGELGLDLLHARFDGIVSSYLGETANNLRRVFAYASQQKAVLFFDEFDAVGKRRDDPQEVGELKRVVSSFLQILDAHPRDRMVVAATNHEGMLDDALWRRFDEILYFGRPVHAQLVELIELRLKSVRKRGVDVDALATEMAGFSYADAERVCLEATKAMLLRGAKEMTRDVLDRELSEQRVRLALAKGLHDKTT
ncbi:MAG: ATP-binding protein [Candidatus Eisenbacteria bacterium]|nr:ATP-binding protein [Candidatus Eisenbacteria bacterium]